MNELEVQVHEERYDHRRDLAPHVDPPPEPAQQEDEPRPGPDLEEDLERLERVL